MVKELVLLQLIFKSQNPSTWTPNQNQDLTFIMNRADFTINATAEAVFRNPANTPEVKADIVQIIPKKLL